MAVHGIHNIPDLCSIDDLCRTAERAIRLEHRLVELHLACAVRTCEVYLYNVLVHVFSLKGMTCLSCYVILEHVDDLLLLSRNAACCLSDILDIGYKGYESRRKTAG